MILQIVVFLVILSILVIVHEFGHFIVGRWAGIGVVEFALGLPFTKSIFSKRLKNGLTLSFYPVLFGGFVNLLGEDEASRQAQFHTPGVQFNDVPAWKRFLVVIAGVTMNAILAIVVFYFFLMASKFQVAIPKLADYNFVSPHQNAIVITDVIKDTPASHAGLNPGDLITSVDGQTFSTSADFQKYVKTHAGSPIILEISDLNFTRAKKLDITPRVNPPSGQGAMGLAFGETIIVRFQSPTEKAVSGLIYTLDMGIYNIRVIAHLVNISFVTKNVEPVAENVSGPIRILSVVGDILGFGGKEAIVGLINLLGVLSISLAVMNVLPFPALDGGRLALITIEWITGKKLSSRNEDRLNRAGMAFLLGLILLISFNDVTRFFKR